MGALTFVSALFWPGAVVAVSVLAYRFGFALLGHRKAELDARASASASASEMDTLRGQVRDLDASVKQLRNTQALSSTRRSVTGI